MGKKKGNRFVSLSPGEGWGEAPCFFYHLKTYTASDNELKVKSLILIGGIK